MEVDRAQGDIFQRGQYGASLKAGHPRLGREKMFEPRTRSPDALSAIPFKDKLFTPRVCIEDELFTPRVGDPLCCAPSSSGRLGPLESSNSMGVLPSLRPTLEDCCVPSSTGRGLLPPVQTRSRSLLKARPESAATKNTYEKTVFKGAHFTKQTAAPSSEDHPELSVCRSLPQLPMGLLRAESGSKPTVLPAIQPTFSQFSPRVEQLALGKENSMPDLGPLKHHGRSGLPSRRRGPSPFGRIGGTCKTNGKRAGDGPELPSAAHCNVGERQHAFHKLADPDVKTKGTFMQRLVSQTSTVSQRTKTSSHHHYHVANKLLECPQSKKISYRDMKGVKCHTTLSELLKMYKIFTEIDHRNLGTVTIEEVQSYARSSYADCLGSMATAAVFAGDIKHLDGREQRFLKNMKQKLKQEDRLSFTDFLHLAHPHVGLHVINQMHKAVMEFLFQQDASVAAAARARRKSILAEEVSRQSAWIESMWTQWDTDGNGQLDKMEFKTVLKEIGADSLDAEQFFEEIDLRQSGLISKSGFTSWWANIFMSGGKERSSQEAKCAESQNAQ